MSTENCIPDICELEFLVVENKTDEVQIECRVSLHFWTGETRLGDGTCEIGIKRSKIRIEANGLEKVTNSLLGELKLQNEVDLTTSGKETNSSGSNKQLAAGATATASTAISKGEISAIGKFSKESTSQREIKTNIGEDRKSHLRVRSLPNLKWLISELDTGYLDGKYLSDEGLVKFTQAEGANRADLKATIQVSQRDIVIKPSGKQGIFSGLGRNKRKLMNVLIGKSLARYTTPNEKYNGDITLSKTEWSSANED